MQWILAGYQEPWQRGRPMSSILEPPRWRLSGHPGGENKEQMEKTVWGLT